MSDLDSLIGDRARDEQGRFKSVTPAEIAPEPVKEVVEAAPAPVAAVAEPAPVTQPVVAQPEPVETEKERGFKRGMHEEREKRQRLEAELRELRTPKTPPVDPWTDLPGALKSQETAFEERLFVERCNLTEDMARSRHTDYDAVRDEFLESAKTNPVLMQQMRAEANPAEFVYREGLRLKELKDVGGDFGAYKTKLEKEIEARVEARLQAKYGAKPAVPTSLNSDASPPAVEPVYAGPKPLNQILRNASRS